MKNFSLFLGLVLSFLAVVFLINYAQPSFDVYGDGRSYLHLMSEIPRAKADTAEAKIKHAKNNETYDVGLFGNSRIWMVGNEHINHEGTIFNFAIPGSSFRQSVSLLKELSRLNKVPRTVVISFDNVSLQLSEDPVYPAFPRRWLERAKDFIYIINNGDLGVKRALIFANNNRAWEFEFFSQAISYKYLKPKVKLLLANFFEFKESKPSLRFDGSFIQKNSFKREIDAPNEYLPKFFMLEHDLLELSKVQEQYDAKIIIYESPTHSDFSEDVEKALGDIPLTDRNKLFSGCEKYGFICYPSPTLIADKNGPYWVDFSHPPAILLGEMIKKTLSLNAMKKRTE